MMMPQQQQQQTTPQEQSSKAFRRPKTSYSSQRRHDYEESILANAILNTEKSKRETQQGNFYALITYLTEISETRQYELQATRTTTRLMTMRPLYPCGKPCSRGTHNETVKNLALFSSIINGITKELRLRISIPWECFLFFNRIENFITFTP